MRVDRYGVWRRAPDPNQGTLTLSDAPAGDGDVSGGESGEGYPASLYGGSPPSVPVVTSEAAAASMRVSANSIRGRVLEAIGTAGERGLTDDEVEATLGLRHQTASARRRELYLLGRIRAVGERRTRSGRRAKVWVVA
jgi:hypothetical protein